MNAPPATSSFAYLNFCNVISPIQIKDRIPKKKENVLSKI